MLIDLKHTHATITQATVPLFERRAGLDDGTIRLK
jgi:hypothetical protein